MKLSFREIISRLLFYIGIWIAALSWSAVNHTIAAPNVWVTLTGKVTEASTGTPVPGATVYIADLKAGSVTDVNGNFTIPNLPDKKLSVQISCIGYKTKILQVDLAVTLELNVTLEVSYAELNEVVVTGLAQATEKNRAQSPVVTITPKQWVEGTGTQVVEMLTKIPGVSQISSGPAVAKPVLRGLGFNRVVVMNDGIRQEGQQWGDEHGLEIDDYSVNRVEILKGPASLMYGSDAMAGVINFLPAPPEPAGKMSAKLTANYQTNNGLIGGALNFRGNKKKFVWDVTASNKMAHAYKNKADGFVYNSGFQSQGISGIAGVNRHWGYSHLHFGVYRQSIGMIEGERDSVTGKFIKPVVQNDNTLVESVTTDSDHTSYRQEVPWQQVSHLKMVLNNSLIIGSGTLKATAGWQQNIREEYGEAFHPDEAGLSFLLNTFNYDARYIFPEFRKIQLSAGLGGMYQDAQNKGTEFLVPEYRLTDLGIYGIARKSLGKLDISGGIRYDVRGQDADGLFLDAGGEPTGELQPGGTVQFTEFSRTFSGFSGSAGASYQVSDRFYTKVNWSVGFRAPNIAELGSNGEHEGTGRYEIGNPALDPESSRQWDLTFGMNSAHVSGEINLFSNTIYNYISIRKIAGSEGADSTLDELSVFEFTSDKARLTGGEISIDIHPHPLDWLHFENTFAYVEGERPGQTGESRWLPFMPAPRFTSELKATRNKISGHLSNAFIKTGIEYNFRQEKVFTLNNTETPTGSYYTVHIAAGADILRKNKKIFSFYLFVNNLFDETYQSHLSRLKYAPENYRTGERGVFEMGRNFSVKVIVPFRHSQ